MSFILDIVAYGLGQFGIKAKGNNPKAISVSAVTNVLEQKINNTIKKSNSAPQNNQSQSTVNSPQPIEDAVKQLEVKVNVDMKADTNASVPVVYGSGFVEGQLIDVAITNNNCTMWYAIAIAEITGTDLNGNPSQLEIENIFLDGMRVVFSSGLVTQGIADAPAVLSTADGTGRTGINEVFLRDRVVDDRYSRGLGSGQSRLNIYLYGSARARQNPGTETGGSNAPIGLRQNPTTNTQPAYNLFPGWTVNHLMSNLCFALVELDFDPERDVTKLGKLTFKLKNSLSNPADVVNDFMTNPIYGGGIPDKEIDK